MSQAKLSGSDMQKELAAVYAIIEPQMAAVERQFRDELGSEDARVDEVIQHGIRLGGKRLRPALLLLAGQAVGELDDAHVVLGAVVEMIHTATLVHDDVLDEAVIRRHTDTVNARWSNETSVLLGDLLYTHAFWLASSVESTYACRTIGRATNLVCDGELRQTTSSGDLWLSEEAYLAIIERKTAELCACCCELGAHYAGGDVETVERLASFGRHLGIAFQIADDLLDLEGEETATGKSLGTDLAKRKMTLPLIHARESLAGAEQEELLKLIGDSSGSDHAALVSLLGRSDSLAYARGEAHRYVEEAQSQLADLAPTPSKDALWALAEFSVARSA